MAIGHWDEEQFTVTIHGAASADNCRDVDWDNIEAVGAADDASRFRIDEPLAETVGAFP